MTTFSNLAYRRHVMGRGDKVHECDADPLAPFLDRVFPGDCRDLMARLPDKVVDLIVTDPPYLVHYREYAGRAVQGDRDNAWVKPVYAELYRVLKDNALCITFYGWHQLGLFATAWREAGFDVVGHLVWTKDYAGGRRYVGYAHESAFVLAKGHPPRPAKAPLDVQPWTYTGNKVHPTQKDPSTVEPFIEAFSKPGDVVFDPFAGAGSFAVAARRLNRRFIAAEVDSGYCRTAEKLLTAANDN